MSNIKPNFEPSEEKKLVDKITFDVQTYIGDWLLKNYPDFGRKWSELHQNAVNETKKLTDVIHNLKQSYEASYRDSGERLKKEIHEFLAQEHPIFGQLTNLSNEIEKVTRESSATLKEVNKLNREAQTSLQEIKEKENTVNSLIQKLSSRSSIYEDIYALREKVDNFSEQIHKFTSAFRKAFNEPDQELLSKRIADIDFDFSVRTINGLVNAGIDTVQDLLDMPEAELLRHRNFGRKCLTEVQQFKKFIGK